MFEKLKKIYQNIKNLNSSVDEFKNESIVQSLPALALVNKAIKLFEENKFPQAKEVLYQAQDISGQEALVFKYLGKIAEKEFNFKQAVEYYEKSSSINPNDKEIWLRLGMCLMYCGINDKANIVFEKADRITPMNTDVYTGWGMSLMKQKKYAHARDKFNKACQISKYNFTAILLSAVMEMRLEEYTSAEEKLTFLVKVAPNESSLYEYAHLKLIQNQYETAQEYALKTINLNKKMLPAYFILGEVYSINKDIQKVNETFKNALDCDLESSMLYFEWGKALIRVFEFEKAEEKFNLCLKLNDKFEEAKIGLALIDAYKNNFTSLDELFEKNQDNVYIQEAYGLKMLYEKNYDSAVEYFKKAIQKDKNQTYIYYDLAQVYISNNDNYKAREFFDKFIDNNPNYLKGLLEYSKWLINISDYEEAHRKLKRAQKLDETNLDVLNLLFFTKYTIVKNNVSEYNIREAISIANKILGLGRFDYEPQKQELENLLKELESST